MKPVMRRGKSKILLWCAAIVLFALSAALLGAEEAAKPEMAGGKTVWADDADISSLDIDSVRQEYSVWGLLSLAVVKKDLGGGLKAEVAYVNPITYIKLFDENTSSKEPAKEMKLRLEGIFKENRLFYIALKSEKDPQPIQPEYWKIKVRKEQGKELLPDRVESTKPEISYGYSGNFYQTKIFAYFPREDDSIDFLRTSSVIIENETLKTKAAFSWAKAGEEKKAVNYVAYHRIFKILLPLLFAALLVVIIVTRPKKAWRSTGI